VVDWGFQALLVAVSRWGDGMSGVIEGKRGERQEEEEDLREDYGS
jgi:hypothetical protein